MRPANAYNSSVLFKNSIFSFLLLYDGIVLVSGQAGEVMAFHHSKCSSRRHSPPNKFPIQVCQCFVFCGGVKELLIARYEENQRMHLLVDCFVLFFGWLGLLSA